MNVVNVCNAPEGKRAKRFGGAGAELRAVS